jgi:hypothetical protein
MTGENPSETELSIASEIDWHFWVTERVVEIFEFNPLISETRNQIERVLHKEVQPQPRLTDLQTKQLQQGLLEIFLW